MNHIPFLGGIPAKQPLQSQILSCVAKIDPARPKVQGVLLKRATTALVGKAPPIHESGEASSKPVGALVTVAASICGGPVQPRKNGGVQRAHQGANPVSTHEKTRRTQWLGRSRDKLPIFDNQKPLQIVSGRHTMRGGRIRHPTGPPLKLNETSTSHAEATFFRDAPTRKCATNKMCARPPFGDRPPNPQRPTAPVLRVAPLWASRHWPEGAGASRAPRRRLRHYA
jgi:hypothetical protein